ncbi:MAG: hypothetical protein LAT81_03595 [Oceanicaulis sp.]|nr:hypothetical protein [Oceanicaulis sp.]
MKINVSSIVVDHFKTFRNDSTKKVSFADIMLFIFLPVISAAITYHTDPNMDQNTYGLAIAFFGVFVALLLNMQVAIFAVFQRKRNGSGDGRVEGVLRVKSKLRTTLLLETNSNISYLILFCSIAMALLLAFSMWNPSGTWVPALLAGFFAHFLTTLLMVVKRCHALFQSEYNSSENSD